MSTRDKSGPAFPCEWDFINSERAPANGMTIRDYFAARAMQGIAPSFADLTSADYCSGAAAKVSKIAYAIADAMLKARSA